MTYRYLVHGLVVESGMALPDLAPAPDGPADVVISCGRATDTAPMEDDSVADDAASFRIPGVAQYGIRGGQSISVTPVAGADLRDVRLFLLGSAMGLLLHQRGAFALHAAAAVIGKRAVALTGPSGAGKSTMALALQRRGVAAMSDDLVVVKPSDDGATVMRAVRRMRLCPDAMEAHGMAPADHDLSYASDDARTKYDVPLLDAPETATLAAIVELAEGQDLLVRLRGLDAVDCLMANSFRGELLSPGRQRSDHFNSCMAIVKQVPVYRLSRPRDLAALDTQLDRVIALVEQSSD